VGITNGVPKPPNLKRKGRGGAGSPSKKKKSQGLSTPGSTIALIKKCLLKTGGEPGALERRSREARRIDRNSWGGHQGYRPASVAEKKKTTQGNTPHRFKPTGGAFKKDDGLVDTRRHKGGTGASTKKRGKGDPKKNDKNYNADFLPKKRCSQGMRQNEKARRKKKVLFKKCCPGH